MSEVETISVNRRAAELAAALRRDAAMLNLGISRGQRDETLIDAGAKHRGGVEAGLRIAEICLGGLGTVRLATDNANAALAVDNRGQIIAARHRVPRESIRGLELGARDWQGRLLRSRLRSGSGAHAKGNGAERHRLSGRSRCRHACHRKRAPTAAGSCRQSDERLRGQTFGSDSDLRS